MNTGYSQMLLTEIAVIPFVPYSGNDGVEKFCGLTYYC